MKEQQLPLSEEPEALPGGTSPPASSSKQPQNTGDFSQTEDAVMKSMMQYFAAEMLPAFGITKKVKALSPTEHVRVEIKKGYQDFNLVLEDNSIAHFEFQSTNGGTKDLRRFRAYEADTSYQLQCPVTTYVLFSGSIQRPMSRLIEGINIYRIRPIIMRKHNADQILASLQRKATAGKPLTRQDLALLPMLPVMGGKSILVDRIESAFRLVASAEHVSKEDISQIEAAIYAMATKFLSNQELEQLRKVVQMTYLGQLLFDDGFNEGFDDRLKKQVSKKLKKGKSQSEIAYELEEDEATIGKVIEEFTVK